MKLGVLRGSRIGAGRHDRRPDTARSCSLTAAAPSASGNPVGAAPGGGSALRHPAGAMRAVTGMAQRWVHMRGSLSPLRRVRTGLLWRGDSSSRAAGDTAGRSAPARDVSTTADRGAEAGMKWIYFGIGVLVGFDVLFVLLMILREWRQRSWPQ